MSQSETYDVYAVRYARSAARPASSNFLHRTADLHDTDMPLDFFVWVIRNENRTVLVDTGFTRETAAAHGHNYLIDVRDALEEIGVRRSAVEHVIVTHMHYDHAGNLDSCPEALLHVQEKELHFAVGHDMENSFMRRTMHVEDVCTAIRFLFGGKLIPHRGSFELAPGIFVQPVGGHTPGMQVVRVATKRGWLVLASDAAHFYANMERVNPFPVLYNVSDNLESWNTLRSLASSEDLIIPGHDPLVMERFPAVNAALDGRAVWLSA